MPPTKEAIREKVPFDVYAVMLVLSALFTGLACWVMYVDLSAHWDWQWEKNTKPVAEHVTQQNTNPAQHPNIIKITDTDRREYELIAKAPIPVKDFEWPRGFDPLDQDFLKGHAVNMAILSANLEVLKISAPEDVPVPERGFEPSLDIQEPAGQEQTGELEGEGFVE